MEAQGGECMHTSCLFTTLALVGVSGQRHAPAALYPRRKDPRYPLDRRLDGPQSRSGHRDQRKNSLCLRRGSNFDLPVVQSVDRHYTDRATPANIFTSAGMIFKNKKFRYGIPAYTGPFRALWTVFQKHESNSYKTADWYNSHLPQQ
jgi:hypothetical protein